MEEEQDEYVVLLDIPNRMPKGYKTNYRQGDSVIQRCLASGSNYGCNYASPQ